MLTIRNSIEENIKLREELKSLESEIQPNHYGIANTFRIILLFIF